MSVLPPPLVRLHRMNRFSSIRREDREGILGPAVKGFSVQRLAPQAGSGASLALRAGSGPARGLLRFTPDLRGSARFLAIALPTVCHTGSIPLLGFRFLWGIVESTASVAVPPAHPSIGARLSLSNGLLLRAPRDQRDAPPGVLADRAAFCSPVAG